MFNKIKVFLKKKKEKDESIKTAFFADKKEILIVKEQCIKLQQEIENFFPFTTPNAIFNKECPLIFSEAFATIKNLKIKQTDVLDLLVETEKALIDKLESKKISRFKNFFKKVISFGKQDYNATINDHIIDCRKEFNELTTKTATIATMMEKVEQWKENKIAMIVKKYDDIATENKNLQAQVSQLKQKNEILNDKKLLDFEKIMTGMNEQLESNKEKCYYFQQKNEELMKENQTLKATQSNKKFGFNKKAINTFLPSGMNTVKKVLQTMS